MTKPNKHLVIATSVLPLAIFCFFLLSFQSEASQSDRCTCVHRSFTGLIRWWNNESALALMKKLTWWQLHRWDVDVDHEAATTIAVVRKGLFYQGTFWKKHPLWLILALKKIPLWTWRMGEASRLCRQKWCLKMWYVYGPSWIRLNKVLKHVFLFNGKSKRLAHP